MTAVIKVSGAMLILLACSWFGFERARMLARRVDWLRRTIHGLHRLETEIMFSGTPLREAILNLQSADERLEHSSFFKTLNDRYQKLLLKDPKSEGGEISKMWSATLLMCRIAGPARESELEILRQLGLIIGLSDRADQQKHLRIAVQRLSQLVEEATTTQTRYQSVWRSFGVLGGALIVLLIY